MVFNPHTGLPLHQGHRQRRDAQRRRHRRLGSNAGPGDDNLYGKGGNDVLHGEDGGDFLNGGDGDDSLYGDGGDDRFYGLAGADRDRRRHRRRRGHVQQLGRAP